MCVESFSLSFFEIKKKSVINSESKSEIFRIGLLRKQISPNRLRFPFWQALVAVYTRIQNAVAFVGTHHSACLVKGSWRTSVAIVQLITRNRARPAWSSRRAVPHLGGRGRDGAARTPTRSVWLDLRAQRSRAGDARPPRRPGRAGRERVSYVTGLSSLVQCQARSQALRRSRRSNGAFVSRVSFFCCEAQLRGAIWWQ